MVAPAALLAEGTTVIRVALLLLVAFVVAVVVGLAHRNRPASEPLGAWREWERVDSV